MKFETISIIIDDRKEIDKVKKALNAFKMKNPNASLGKPRFGELSGKILITFKVDNEYSSELILAFAHNYITVLATTDKIKKKVEKATAQYAEALAKNSKDWDEMKIEQPKMSISELESFAQSGNYNEIIKIASDLIVYGEKIVEKAKNVLDESVKNAIEKAYKKAIDEQEFAEDSINRLIKVSADSRLRIMNKWELMQEAGKKAIDLIVKYPQFSIKLVEIANNAEIHNYINILAFITFGNIVYNEKEQHKEAIEEATRLLNLRWIEIAYDVATSFLSEKEKELFKKYLKYFRNRKEALKK